MLNEKEDLAKIMKFTGLTKEEIGTKLDLIVDLSWNSLVTGIKDVKEKMVVGKS